MAGQSDLTGPGLKRELDWMAPRDPFQPGLLCPSLCGLECSIGAAGRWGGRCFRKVQVMGAAVLGQELSCGVC